MTHNFDSDSDESDFSGFESDDILSDVEVPLLHEEFSDDDDDDIGTDIPIDEWTQNYTAPRIEDFVGRPGPNLPNDFDPETATPLDYFWLLFPVNLIGMIVRYTNGYAAWKQAVDGPDPCWFDITEPEMRAFLSINILMGINQMPRVQMYWSTDPLLSNTGIKSIMTCNRFTKIIQYFHVSDRTQEPVRGQPGYDRLFKVREIMNVLSHTFMDRYTLSREACVDEAMIKYTGRLSFRQYMPAKPIKRGMKVWMLCDSNSAYLSRFELYLGKQQAQPEHGLGHHVVSRLSSHLHHSNRCLFFDNFFTGLPLLQSLLSNGLYACGTVRINRQGFPAALKKPHDLCNRGDMRVMQQGGSNVTASAWKDKKLVHTLSTLSNPTDIHQARRRVGAEVVLVNQPHSVWTYNKFMGGVDLHDQLRMNYSVGRNGKKWWRYLFWFMLNCALVNSFIIYKDVSSRITKKKRYCHIDFRMELLRQLLGGFSKRKRPARDPLMQQVVHQENIGAHINIRLPGRRTTCKHHSRAFNKRKDTVYGCVICNVHLCKDCHRLYHADD